MARLGIICTYYCNFKCKHCYQLGVGKKHIDTKIVEKALRQSSKLGFYTVHLSGGELCTHPKFKKIIELVEKHKFKFSIGTNAYNYEKYEFAFEKKLFTHVSTSIDGVKKTHNLIRKKGSFEKSMEFLDKYSDKLNIHVVMTLNKHNYSEIEKVIKLLIKKK